MVIIDHGLVHLQVYDNNHHHPINYDIDVIHVKLIVAIFFPYYDLDNGEINLRYVCKSGLMVS